ncbi:uncharacterized protein LOC143004334 [Genypterus blacodes]|uniref:uncharacterized protein LOC143004334 n=1 Tax=Genypterus blacodes TaxID=154954 RepID=UPI003F76F053
MTKLHLLLCVQALSQVLCEVLPPLQDMHVSDGTLSWSPAPSHTSVTYTVQYRSFDKQWTDVTACVQTSLASCDVTSTASAEDPGCVRLRARAERAGLSSPWTEACSRRGNPCSPEVRLAPRPSSLYVVLSKNHSMAREYGGHAWHRVFYGKEGQPLQDIQEGTASVSIPELEEGQTYCVQVQYMLYTKPNGEPSCVQCVLIPKSNTETHHTKVVVPVVVVVVVMAIMTGIIYVLMYKSKGIKKWLRQPYQISKDVCQPLPEKFREVPLTMGDPGEERCDEIFLIYRDAAHESVHSV